MALAADFDLAFSVIWLVSCDEFESPFHTLEPGYPHFRPSQKTPIDRLILQEIIRINHISQL